MSAEVTLRGGGGFQEDDGFANMEESNLSMALSSEQQLETPEELLTFQPSSSQLALPHLAAGELPAG